MVIFRGEPFLRSDFLEIFDYITRKSKSYSLNTNGSLITPDIARLMTRKGRKMVAIYGATADIHDYVTRKPGSFEATMQGFAYLREAGAGFIVQIVPMKANYHQLGEMKRLAESLSPLYRFGAAWLWLSACRSPVRNCDIIDQRLEAKDLMAIDGPTPLSVRREILADMNAPSCMSSDGDDCLLRSCIDSRDAFHIDPYGGMSFCCFVVAPGMRADLRKMSFNEAWDDFIPSMADLVKGGKEYSENCGACDMRKDCRWCAVYSYLEHGRFSAKVEYLCGIAAETRRIKENFKLTHRQYYRIAGITIQVTSDLQLKEDTFSPVIRKFRVDEPGEDIVSIHLTSSLPRLADLQLGKEVYRRPPWAIYRQNNSWAYLEITSEDREKDPYCVAIWDESYSHGTIYRRPESMIKLFYH